MQFITDHDKISNRTISLIDRKGLPTEMAVLMVVLTGGSCEVLLRGAVGETGPFSNEG
jgi:hypothetical protein